MFVSNALGLFMLFGVRHATWSHLTPMFTTATMIVSGVIVHQYSTYTRTDTVVQPESSSSLVLVWVLTVAVVVYFLSLVMNSYELGLFKSALDQHNQSLRRQLAGVQKQLDQTKKELDASGVKLVAAHRDHHRATLATDSLLALLSHIDLPEYDLYRHPTVEEYARLRAPDIPSAHVIASAAGIPSAPRIPIAPRIRNVLRDPVATALLYQQVTLRKTRENLCFLLQVRQYRSTPDGFRRDVAKSTIEQFVANTAPARLNTHHVLAVEAAYHKSLIKEELPPLELFDVLEDEIITLVNTNDLAQWGVWRNGKYVPSYQFCSRLVAEEQKIN